MHTNLPIRQHFENYRFHTHSLTYIVTSLLKTGLISGCPPFSVTMFVFCLIGEGSVKLNPIFSLIQRYIFKLSLFITKVDAAATGPDHLGW